MFLFCSTSFSDYHLNQSKIQRLSKPPICGPIPSDAAFYLLFPSLIHFTPSSLVPCCLSCTPGLLPFQGLSFIVLPMSMGCPRCLCGWFSPLLQACLESSQVSDSHLPWESSYSHKRESLSWIPGRGCVTLSHSSPEGRGQGGLAWAGPPAPLLCS